MKEYVWVIRFLEDPFIRVAKTAELAYAICREYIEEIASEEVLNECLAELEADYTCFPEQFGCEDMCNAEKIELEG